MKKSLFLLFVVLLFTACGDVSDFQAQLQSSDDVAKSIANNLAESYDEIEDCNVQVDGATAVVSLDLAHEHSDAELIALKKRVAADIRSQNSTIKRVAVNTAPDMLENIRGMGDDETEVEKSLEKNSDEEIFVNIAPTI